MTARIRRSLGALTRVASAAVRSATAAAAVAAVCAGGFPVIWAAAAKASTAEVTAPLTTAVQPAQRNFAMAPELDMAAWSRLGQPDRLIIVRVTSIDVIQNGILVAHTFRAGGTVTIPSLASALGGAAWISMPSPNTAVLSAALLLSPGTSMQVGPDVRRLLLSGGMTRASASWIRCEHASLTISGVAVDSLRMGNAAGWPPVPASWAGRPYVYAAAGARLDVLGSTLSDLGEPGSPRRASPPGSAMKARSLPAPWVAAAAGVIWGKGSTGSAVNAQFKRNEVGLLLDGSVGVRLSHVAVENSGLDGLVLRGDRATSLRYLVSRSNGGSGVIISGPGPRHLSGLMASANAATGLTAVTQTGLDLTGVRTDADMGGGVRLVDCVRCTVNGLVAAGDQPTALTISGASDDVNVSGADLNGGQTGITIAAGTRAVTLSGAVVTGFNRLGIEVAGSDARVLSSRISGSAVGVRVYGPATQIQLSGVTIRGGRDGVTLTRTAGPVSLSDISVTGVSHDGVRSASAALRVSGGDISGAHVGIALLSSAALVGVDINRVVLGIQVRAPVTITASRINVVAERDGIKADADARVNLSDSVIRAPITLSGAGYISRDSRTVLSLPPIPWLGLSAIAAVLLAIILQATHHMRRRSVPVQARPHARAPDAGGFGPKQEVS